MVARNSYAVDRAKRTLRSHWWVPAIALVVLIVGWQVFFADDGEDTGAPAPTTTTTTEPPLGAILHYDEDDRFLRESLEILQSITPPEDWYVGIMLEGLNNSDVRILGLNGPDAMAIVILESIADSDRWFMTRMAQPGDVITWDPQSREHPEDFKINTGEFQVIQPQAITVPQSYQFEPDEEN